MGTNLKATMQQEDLTDEHLNLLEVPRENPDSLLREIHDGLVAIDESRFEYSPEYGEGWNGSGGRSGS